MNLKSPNSTAHSLLPKDRLAAAGLHTDLSFDPRAPLHVM